MKRKLKYGYACPYNNFGCDKIDTSDMSRIDCEYCNHYNGGRKVKKELNDAQILWNALKRMFR